MLENNCLVHSKEGALSSFGYKSHTGKSETIFRSLTIERCETQHQHHYINRVDENSKLLNICNSSHQTALYT